MNISQGEKKMGRKAIDLTGKRFGELIVLHRTTQEEHPHPQGQGYHVIWTCLCDCGKISYVQSGDLKNGHVKSCGHNFLIDLTGKRFGRLTVLRKVPYEEQKYNTDQSPIWECKCDCGKIIIVLGKSLKSGTTRSCGCLRDEVAVKNLSKRGPSKGEQKIIEILNKEHIRFESEKVFTDEKRVSRYRYDFYLPDMNICIEFQGMQHMVYSPFFYKNRSDFTKAQERDRLKISYCLAHNIPLYCIPYWDLEKLKNFEDLVKPEYLVRSKFHNDDAWRAHQNRR